MAGRGARPRKVVPNKKFVEVAEKKRLRVFFADDGKGYLFVCFFVCLFVCLIVC